MDNNAMRLLAASGPLMQQGFPSGMPRPMFPPNLSAVGMEQANQLQQALRNQMMCQNMPPELSSEVLASQMPRAPFMMDPNTVAFHPYLALDGGRRRNATREITQPLKTWLTEHKKNPYPSKPEKIMLAMFTGMTLTQVSTWFANARRRLKKENKMTWSPRNGRGDSDDDDDFDPSETLETSTEMKSDLKLDIKSEIELNSPKKHKIWSIAENLQNSRAESTNSNASKDSKPEEDTKIGGMSNNPLNNMQIPTGQQSSGFNPLMMAAMNRMLPPQFYAAFMQQQAQAQQAQAQVQQQQLAAMLRNAGAFPSMFLNNFFGMPGMNLPGPSNVQIPSTSSSTSPNPDLVNTSDNCDTIATTSSNLANTSGSATTTSDDRESRSPSPLLKIPKFEQTELSPEKKKSDDSTNCSSSK